MDNIGLCKKVMMSTLGDDLLFALNKRGHTEQTDLLYHLLFSGIYDGTWINYLAFVYNYLSDAYEKKYDYWVALKKGSLAFSHSMQDISEEDTAFFSLTECFKQLTDDEWQIFAYYLGR